MRIARRLALSFSAILFFFAANLGVYLWSTSLRNSSMAALQRALTRQVLIANINQRLDNLHKQVTLFSEEAGASAPDPEVRRLFFQQLDYVSDQISRLKAVSEPDERQQISQLEQTYGRVATAWRSFFDYLGVEQSWALAHLIRADPLTQQLLTGRIPHLQSVETARVERLEARVAEVTHLTWRITLSLFIFSLTTAIAVAFLLSRYLTRGLRELRRGAIAVGSMNFGERIHIESQDELGELANAFNQMGEQLSHAQNQLETRARELDKQRRISESLLLNILPAEIAEELEAKGAVDPRYYEDVTIIFTDFTSFMLSTEKLSAEELVHLLDVYFTSFDHIVSRYRLEKLKTIGDSYMCVGGIPTRTPSHPVDALLAAFAMLDSVEEHACRPDAPVRWGLRVGMHTGPVVAGVVGINKFAFDIWGDSVNHASRMEATGARGRINVSAATYQRVKDFFECEYRGKVPTKEGKELDMYFATRILPALNDTPVNGVPAAFLRRYHTYFQKEPPAFPACLLETQLARKA